MGQVLKKILLVFSLTFFCISYGQNESLATPTVRAQFPGGQIALIKYLQSNVSDKANYPDNGIKPERIVAKFFIDEKGKAIDVKIIKSSGHQYIDELFIQAIYDMPIWTPAENPKGKKVRQEIPITFHLNIK